MALKRLGMEISEEMQLIWLGNLRSLEWISAECMKTMVCGTQEIELFIIKNAPARVNYPEALGLRHLAFKVKSVDDTVKELNGKGIETEPVRLDDYTGKRMTFFHDPDGLPLEIHE